MEAHDRERLFRALGRAEGVDEVSSSFMMQVAAANVQEYHCQYYQGVRPS